MTAAAPDRHRVWPQGHCSVCRRRRQLRGDGNIRRHPDPDGGACAGSGRPPRAEVVWLSNEACTLAHGTVDPLPSDLDATWSVLPGVRPLCGRGYGLIKPPTGEPLPRCHLCEQRAAALTGG